MGKNAFVSLHGRQCGFDGNFIYVHGRPIGNALVGQGKTFYVDSGVDNTSGENPDNAVGTIDEAINLCTADRGDTIVVMPGHSETLGGAAAIDIDVNGISIIGLGNDGDRPQIIFDTATDTVEVNADNIFIQNIRFTSSVTAVAVGVNVLTGSTSVHLDRCRFDAEALGTDEFELAVRFAAGCDRGAVTNCEFDMDLAGAVMAIQVIDCDAPVIKGNKIMGDYSTACVGGLTTLSTNVDIGGNLLLNGEGGGLNTEPCIELITGTTGIIYDNYCVTNLATKAASIVADTCMLFENYYNEDAGGSGTGGLIGTASADD